MILADDIILYTILSHNYSALIQHWIQQEIDALTNWLNAQLMQVSPTKTKFKIFYNKYIQKKDKNINSPPQLYLYNKRNIPSDKPIKYLGYYHSYNLNRMYHINYTIKKANHAFHIINCFKYKKY